MIVSFSEWELYWGGAVITLPVEAFVLVFIITKDIQIVDSRNFLYW